MSFHPPPQSTMVPPPLHVGPQGNLMPGYLPSAALAAGLPPPPMPPPFPAFSVPPPGQPAIQPTLIPNSSTHQKMQPPRPQYHGRKPNELFDKRRDQFRPVSSSDKPTVTVFVGNITEHASDALIRQLLMKCGIVVNWKRVQGADGKLQAFGFCEYIDPEAGLRAIRLLHDLSVGEKNLVVKVDAKTKAMLEEYKKNKATQQRGSNSWNEENKNGEDELDEATLSQDSDVRKNITGLLTDNADVLSGKFKGTTNKWRASHSGSEENLEGMGMDKDKKHLISREIRFFRDAYKDSEKDKKDRGKDDKEYEKDKKETRDNERDRDRDRGKERPRDRSQERDYERSRSNERSRDRSRSKDRDRGREDRDKGREDRDKGREDRDRGRQNRDRELDEDEQYEKRKRERKQKERNQAFVERLKAWEGRERKKLRDYDREMEKDRELENEQAREKKHLLEFLEDYDDEQDDPKYYRGGSFDRRLQARLLEMESDDKDRKRELEEIEEIRKRLGEEAVVEEEEEAMEEEPAVEVDPEPRPTLQATFKPAVHVVEAAPNIPSPAYESPKNSPKVNVVNKTKPQQEESVDNMDSETATKKTFIFEMKTKTAVGSSNSNRKKLEAVFNSEEDATANKGSKRKLVPLDYSEEEMKAVGNAAAKNAEDKKKSIKSLIERIPTAKVELFAYSLDWDCVDQILIDRRIRPWVNKKIVEYIGEEEPSLVDFMCSKLLARSQPENILRDVSMVLDDEAEVFVVKMWRLLIYETEAKKIGLVK